MILGPGSVTACRLGTTAVMLSPVGVSSIGVAGAKTASMAA